MAKVTIDLDDEMLARLAEFSRARNVTVEDLILTQAKSVADMRYDAIPNASHRTIVAALDRPEDYYESKRDRDYDRELGRAESYVHNRRRLLALIDATEGDLGVQSWRRASLYDR